VCAPSFISPPSSCCEEEEEEEPTPPPPPAPTPSNVPVTRPDNNNNGNTTVRRNKSTSRTSNDPNEKLGPVGWDGQGSVLTDTLMVYTVFFENTSITSGTTIIVPVPAQEVFINDQLSTNLDWETIRFTEVAFGEHTLPIQNTGTSFQTQHTIQDYRDPTQTWLVDISGALDPATGMVDWTFRTLDPDTGQLPSDVDAGFLPANDETGRGEGHVTFSIAQKPNLGAGTVITNRASIIFDVNDAIVTNVYMNVVGGPVVYLPLILR
jgi:hypothetical protein